MPAPASDPRSAPRIVPVRGAERRAVLADALRLRRAGAVPLIGDERWSEGHWARLVEGAETFAAARPDVVARAGWAAFTSGSSGSPRIVLRTAASWDCFFPVVDQWLSPGLDDVLLLPAHPVASLTVNGLAWADAAGVAWTVPSGGRIRAEDLAGSPPDDAASCPRTAAPTLVHGTPAHLVEILDLVEAGTPHRLRAALVGGDRLPAGLRERAEASGIRVIAYYGAAELSFVAADHGHGLHAVPGVRCTVRDGQLLARTSQAALGVLAMPTAHGAPPVWTPLEGSGPSGDLHGVGDLADIDEDGRIRLRGRADDAILTAGATVVPADVEAVLAEHPAVAACLVHAEPRERVGSLVAAAVELVPQARERGAAAVLEDVRAWSRDRLAPAQRPRLWRHVTALPRTASGKIRRLDARGVRALAETPSGPADRGTTLEGGTP